MHISNQSYLSTIEECPPTNCVNFPLKQEALLSCASCLLPKGLERVREDPSVEINSFPSRSDSSSGYLRRVSGGYMHTK